MVVEERNCIFVHIPKNAGQSIEKTILEDVGSNWENRSQYLLRKNRDPRKGPPRLAHLLAREYVEKGYVTQDFFDGAYKFAIVRNPYTRLVSEYRYRCHLRSFESFVKNLHKYADNYKSGDDFARHLVPQVEYIYARDGRSLVDEVIKFEDLKHKPFLLEKVGVESPLQSTNVTGKKKNSLRVKVKSVLFNIFYDKGKDVEQYYTEEAKARVDEFYKEDFQKLGYDSCLSCINK